MIITSMTRSKRKIYPAHGSFCEDIYWCVFGDVFVQFNDILITHPYTTVRVRHAHRLCIRCPMNIDIPRKSIATALRVTCARPISCGFSTASQVAHSSPLPHSWPICAVEPQGAGHHISSAQSTGLAPNRPTHTCGSKPTR